MIFLISKGQEIFFIQLESSHTKQSQECEGSSRNDLVSSPGLYFQFPNVISGIQSRHPPALPQVWEHSSILSHFVLFSEKRQEESFRKSQMIQIQGHTPISKVTFFKWRKRTALDTEKRQWDMHLWRTGLKKQDKKRQVERYLCLFCGKSLGSGRAWGLSRRKCCCQDLLATFTGKWRTKHAAEIKWICSQGSMLRFICFICTEIRVGCCPSQTAPQPIPLQSRREAGWQLILHGLFHWLLTWTECTFSAVAFGQHWDSYHDLDL